MARRRHCRAGASLAAASATRAGDPPGLVTGHPVLRQPVGRGRGGRLRRRKADQRGIRHGADADAGHAYGGRSGGRSRAPRRPWPRRRLQGSPHGADRLCDPAFAIVGVSRGAGITGDILNGIARGPGSLFGRALTNAPTMAVHGRLPVGRFGIDRDAPAPSTTGAPRVAMPTGLWFRWSGWPSHPAGSRAWRQSVALLTHPPAQSPEGRASAHPVGREEARRRGVRGRHQGVWANHAAHGRQGRRP